MRKIFMLALCMCAMGFARPDWENPKCYEVDGIMHDLYRKWKTENDGKYLRAVNSFFSNFFAKNCECISKINCTVDLCTSYKCNGEEEAASIFADIQSFVAKVGGGGSISGSDGQPPTAGSNE